MVMYVYCPRKSNGALELVKALGAVRLRKFDGINFWDKKKKVFPKADDSIICWGATVPDLVGIRVLNSAPEPANKLKELNTLYAAGIPTIVIYGGVENGNYGLGHQVLGRRVNHVGGRDLLNTPDLPDFYVIKEDFVTEYRIHSFSGRSIRSGIKVPREGFVPATEANWKPNANLVHPWIRSFDAGWRVKYDAFVSTQKMRGLATKAVAAMGLTFGAVDIGEDAAGNLKVLEVNRGPGIEGNSVTAYVRAITKWLAKDEGAKDL